MTKRKNAALGVRVPVLILLAILWEQAEADQHAGCYYPESQSIEEYVSKTLT